MDKTWDLEMWNIDLGNPWPDYTFISRLAVSVYPCRVIMVSGYTDFFLPVE